MVNNGLGRGLLMCVSFFIFWLTNGWEKRKEDDYNVLVLFNPFSIETFLLRVLGCDSMILLTLGRVY